MQNTSENRPSAAVEVECLGIGTQHDIGLSVGRPHGLPHAWLVMCFATAFWCQTSEGTVSGLPGNCVIHPPGFPYWHGTLAGARQGFCNDWVHLKGRNIERLIATYGLPVNTLIPTGQPRLLLPFLQNLQQEVYLQDPFWEAAVGLTTASMLLQIARHRTLEETPLRPTPAERERLVSLTRARIHIHHSLQDAWTVPRMACLVGLSPNRFAVLYKQFFQVSPTDDLLWRRMDHAKHLLSSTNVSIGEAAGLCGFNNVYYFSRLFRQRLGITPSVYAHLKRHAASDENTPGKIDP